MNELTNPQPSGNPLNLSYKGVFSTRISVKNKSQYGQYLDKLYQMMFTGIRVFRAEILHDIINAVMLRQTSIDSKVEVYKATRDRYNESVILEALGGKLNKYGNTLISSLNAHRIDFLEQANVLEEVTLRKILNADYIESLISRQITPQYALLIDTIASEVSDQKRVEVSEELVTYRLNSLKSGEVHPVLLTMGKSVRATIEKVDTMLADSALHYADIERLDKYLRGTNTHKVSLSLHGMGDRVKKDNLPFTDSVVSFIGKHVDLAQLLNIDSFDSSTNEMITQREYVLADRFKIEFATYMFDTLSDILPEKAVLTVTDTDTLGLLIRKAELVAETAYKVERIAKEAIKDSLLTHVDKLSDRKASLLHYLLYSKDSSYKSAIDGQISRYVNTKGFASESVLDILSKLGEEILNQYKTDDLYLEAQEIALGLTEELTTIKINQLLNETIISIQEKFNGGGSYNVVELTNSYLGNEAPHQRTIELSNLVSFSDSGALPVELTGINSAVGFNVQALQEDGSFAVTVRAAEIGQDIVNDPTNGKQSVVSEEKVYDKLKVGFADTVIEASSEPKANTELGIYNVAIEVPTLTNYSSSLYTTGVTVPRIDQDSPEMRYEIGASVPKVNQDTNESYLNVGEIVPQVAGTQLSSDDSIKGSHYSRQSVLVGGGLTADKSGYSVLEVNHYVATENDRLSVILDDLYVSVSGTGRNSTLDVMVYWSAEGKKVQAVVEQALTTFDKYITGGLRTKDETVAADRVNLNEGLALHARYYEVLPSYKEAVDESLNALKTSLSARESIVQSEHFSESGEKNEKEAVFRIHESLIKTAKEMPEYRGIGYEIADKVPEQTETKMVNEAIDRMKKVTHKGNESGFDDSQRIQKANQPAKIEFDHDVKAEDSKGYMTILEALYEDFNAILRGGELPDTTDLRPSAERVINDALVVNKFLEGTKEAEGIESTGQSSSMIGHRPDKNGAVIEVKSNGGKQMTATTDGFSLSDAKRGINEGKAFENDGLIYTVTTRGGDLLEAPSSGIRPIFFCSDEGNKLWDSFKIDGSAVLKLHLPLDSVKVDVKAENHFRPLVESFRVKVGVEDGLSAVETDRSTHKSLEDDGVLVWKVQSGSVGTTLLNGSTRLSFGGSTEGIDEKGLSFVKSVTGSVQETFAAQSFEGAGELQELFTVTREISSADLSDTVALKRIDLFEAEVSGFNDSLKIGKVFDDLTDTYTTADRFQYDGTLSETGLIDTWKLRDAEVGIIPTAASRYTDGGTIEKGLSDYRKVIDGAENSSDDFAIRYESEGTVADVMAIYRKVKVGAKDETLYGMNSDISEGTLSESYPYSFSKVYASESDDLSPIAERFDYDGALSTTDLVDTTKLINDGVVLEGAANYRKVVEGLIEEVEVSADRFQYEGALSTSIDAIKMHHAVTLDGESAIAYREDNGGFVTSLLDAIKTNSAAVSVTTLAERFVVNEGTVSNSNLVDTWKIREALTDVDRLTERLDGIDEAVVLEGSKLLYGVNREAVYGDFHTMKRLDGLDQAIVPEVQELRRTEVVSLLAEQEAFQQVEDKLGFVKNTVTLGSDFSRHGEVSFDSSLATQFDKEGVTAGFTLADDLDSRSGGVITYVAMDEGTETPALVHSYEEATESDSTHGVLSNEVKANEIVKDNTLVNTDLMAKELAARQASILNEDAHGELWNDQQTYVYEKFEQVLAELSNEAPTLLPHFGTELIAAEMTGTEHVLTPSLDVDFWGELTNSEQVLSPYFQVELQGELTSETETMVNSIEREIWGDLANEPTRLEPELYVEIMAVETHSKEGFAKKEYEIAVLGCANPNLKYRRRPDLEPDPKPKDPLFEWVCTEGYVCDDWLIVPLKDFNFENPDMDGFYDPTTLEPYFPTGQYDSDGDPYVLPPYSILNEPISNGEDVGGKFPMSIDPCNLYSYIQYIVKIYDAHKTRFHASSPVDTMSRVMNMLYEQTQKLIAEWDETKGYSIDELWRIYRFIRWMALGLTNRFYRVKLEYAYGDFIENFESFPFSGLIKTEGSVRKFINTYGNVLEGHPLLETLQNKASIEFAVPKKVGSSTISFELGNVIQDRPDEVKEGGVQFKEDFEGLSSDFKINGSGWVTKATQGGTSLAIEEPASVKTYKTNTFNVSENWATPKLTFNYGIDTNMDSKLLLKRKSDGSIVWQSSGVVDYGLATVNSLSAGDYYFEVKVPQAESNALRDISFTPEQIQNEWKKVNYETDWRVEGNTIYEEENTGGVAMVINPQWMQDSEYEIECEFYTEEDSSLYWAYDWLGLVFNYKDSNNYYLVGTWSNLDSGNRAGVARITNGNAYALVNPDWEFNADFRWKFNTWHKMKLVVKGNQFTVYVDGVKYVEATDNQGWGFGASGLAAWSNPFSTFRNVKYKGKPRFDAFIDNVQVESPNVYVPVPKPKYLIDFILDGESVPRIDDYSSEGKRAYSFPILEGEHSGQWVFKKEGDERSVSLDASFIDNIVIKGIRKTKVDVVEEFISCGGHLAVKLLIENLLEYYRRHHQGCKGERNIWIIE